MELSFFASNVAKDSAFGGNLYDIHTPYDRTDREFLAKVSTLHYREFGVGVQCKPTEWLWLHLSQSFYTGDYEGYRLSGSAGITW